MSPNCSAELLNEKVTTTGLTHEWILNILNKHDSTFEQTLNGNTVTLVRRYPFLYFFIHSCIFLQINAHDISVDKGFVSKVYKVTIFVDNKKESCYKCVIKIPTTEHLNHLMNNLNFDDDKNKVI